MQAVRFYEVLARYYQRAPDSAFGVLHLLQVSQQTGKGSTWGCGAQNGKGGGGSGRQGRRGAGMDMEQSAWPGPGLGFMVGLCQGRETQRRETDGGVDTNRHTFKLGRAHLSVSPTHTDAHNPEPCAVRAEAAGTAVRRPPCGAPATPLAAAQEVGARGVGEGRWGWKRRGKAGGRGPGQGVCGGIKRERQLGGPYLGCITRHSPTRLLRPLLHRDRADQQRVQGVNMMVLGARQVGRGQQTRV